MARNPFTKRSPFGLLAVLLTGILTFAVVVFIIGEGIDLSQLGPVDRMMLGALGVMLGGLWLGMLHSLTGAVICFGGFGWFLSLNGAISLGVVLYAFPVIAALHLGQALLVRTHPEEKGMTDADRRRARIAQVQREWEEKQRALEAKKAGGDVNRPMHEQSAAPPPPPTPTAPVSEPAHSPPSEQAWDEDEEVSPPPPPDPVRETPTGPAPNPAQPPDETEPAGNTLGSPGDGRASAPLPGWVPEDVDSDDESASPPPPHRSGEGPQR